MNATLLTSEELGVRPVTRTTMGQPVLAEKKVYGLPMAGSRWEVFKKKYIPNFGYKGRRRRGFRDFRGSDPYKSDYCI